MQQQLDNIRVGAIATCVPSRVVTNDDLASAFGEKAMSRFGKSTGIHERRVATNQSALDLCCFAAEKLFESGFDRADVDGVVFVSQTPEYILPASAAIAQDRLGLRHDIAAFDVNLGCSGYVYGLLIAGKLLAGQSGGSILLLVGDTSPGFAAPKIERRVPSSAMPGRRRYSNSTRMPGLGPSISPPTEAGRMLLPSRPAALLRRVRT